MGAAVPLSQLAASNNGRAGHGLPAGWRPRLALLHGRRLLLLGGEGYLHGAVGRGPRGGDQLVVHAQVLDHKGLARLNARGNSHVVDLSSLHGDLYTSRGESRRNETTPTGMGVIA